MYKVGNTNLHGHTNLDMSERKGHRKLRLSSKKNYERKKAAKRAILKHAASAVAEDRVEILTRSQKELVSLPIHLPLELYTNQEATTLGILNRRLHEVRTISEGQL